MLDQNTSNEVMRRRHATRLPLVYEARNLFNTPGAGTSNPPVVNRVEAPGTGTPAQPHTTDLPHQNNIPPQYVPTPSGHYSNPLDNMIAAATRLAALPVEGESPAVIETRRARELLQTSLVQQQAYSYSRDRIHSTPRPSRSYSRHIDEPAVSSSRRHHNLPRGHNPAGEGADAQNVVDQGRAPREAELAAQYAARQPTLVRSTTSVEPGVTFRNLGVPCLVPALRDERLPKDFKVPARCPIT